MLANQPKSSAVVEIERLNLAWQEESQFDLANLSKDRRVQVREPAHYAPPAAVASYAVQMGQTQFPPIIVTRNHWLVDGNTRVGAKDVRKEKFSPAIILDVDYKGGAGKHDAEIEALAATLNQQGGSRLTPAESRTMARKLVGLNWKPDQIGRAVGLKATIVGHIKRELAAEAKFDKVGLNVAGKISPATLRAFGLDAITSINDVPYKELVELTRDANLGVKEIKEMAAEMKATGSDHGMIDHVKKRRGEMVERIKAHALQGNGKPPASSQLRRHLGFVNTHSAEPGVLVEKAPEAMADHLKAVNEAIATLQVVAKLQEALIDD